MRSAKTVRQALDRRVETRDSTSRRTRNGAVEHHIVILQVQFGGALCQRQQVVQDRRGLAVPKPREGCFHAAPELDALVVGFRGRGGCAAGPAIGAGRYRVPRCR